MIANKYHIGDEVLYKYPKKENTLTSYILYKGTILTIGDNFGSVYYQILRDISVSKYIDTINEKDITELIKEYNPRKQRATKRKEEMDNNIYIGMTDMNIIKEGKVEQ